MGDVVDSVSGHAAVRSGSTVVSGVTILDLSYSLQLKFGTLPNDRSFEVVKEDTNDQVQDEDLFHPSSSYYRIIIQENIADDGGSIEDKCDFYKAKGLIDKIYVYLPLKLTVTKVMGESASNFNSNEAQAVFEIIDPSEEISNIKGPISTGRTGKNFIQNIVYNQDGTDNCHKNFAPPSLQNACRQSSEGLDAQSILFNNAKQRLSLDPQNHRRITVPLRELLNEDGVQKGVAEILFHPPPIAGDNYRIRVTLTDSNGQSVRLRDEPNSELYLQYLETHTITVWKRLKIEMVAFQHGVEYNTLDWNAIKSAYRDAFIEIMEPPNEKRYLISDWKKYLGEVVYHGWHTNEWNEYSKLDNVVDQIIDFDKFSFPQAHDDIPGSNLLTPMDDNPQNPNKTTWALLSSITKAIVKDKLGLANYNRLKNAKTGTDLGICLLICKLPFEGSRVGGMSIFDKMFYMINSGAATAFVHELGHALFLRHGATFFVQNSSFPFTTRSETASQSGPFWDDHDSKDIIPCVMAYENYPPVEWHFCGLCLLSLRLYDKNRMISDEDNTLRNILYSNAPELCWAEETTIQTTDPDGVIWEEPYINVDPSNPPPLNVGKTHRLLAFYPQEGITNNLNFDFYKDITKHPRGRWKSNHPNIASVGVRKRNNIWICSVKAKSRGTAEIYYEIRRSRNWDTVDKSGALTITVT